MASMYVEYAIRNVQTGNFVSYMSDDGSQYKEEYKNFSSLFENGIIPDDILEIC